MNELLPKSDKAKLWKLVLLVVPALISGVFSYFTARAESTDESQATFEYMQEQVDKTRLTLTVEVDRSRALEQDVRLLQAQLNFLYQQPKPLHPLVSPPSPPSPLPPLLVRLPLAVPDAGVARPSFLATDDTQVQVDVAAPSPTWHRKSVKPRSFEDVVQRYKSKK